MNTQFLAGVNVSGRVAQAETPISSRSRSSLPASTASEWSLSDVGFGELAHRGHAGPGCGLRSSSLKEGEA